MPAFGNEIIKTTRSGWNHIIASPKRNRQEVLTRIRLLFYARELLEKSTFIQSYRNSGDIEHWSLQGLFNNIPIRVIVRSKNKGQKHFYSVFSPASKNHQRRHQNK